MKIIKIAAPVIGLVILSSSFTAFAEEFDGNVNFQPSEIHSQIIELIQSGDIEGANELRDELRSQFGNQNRVRPDGFQPNGEFGHMGGKMGEMKEVLDNGDYDAWVELMQDRLNFGDNVNQDTFQSMIDIHELMESGDEEAANELRKQFIQDLGLENIVRPDNGHRGGRGFHMNR